MDVPTLITRLVGAYIERDGTFENGVFEEEGKELFRDMLEHPPEPYEVSDWLFHSRYDDLAALVEKLGETERTARQSRVKTALRQLRTKYLQAAAEADMEKNLDPLLKQLVKGAKPDLRKKGSIREMFPESPQRERLSVVASEVKGTMNESLRVKVLNKLGSTPEEISELMADASTGSPQGIEKVKKMFEWLKGEMKAKDVALRTYTVYLSSVRNWVRKELMKAGDLSNEEAKQILYKVDAYDPTSTKVVKEMQREVVEDNREETETRVAALMKGEANPEGVAYVLGMVSEIDLTRTRDQKGAVEGFNTALYIALSVAMSSRPGELCDPSGDCLLSLTEFKNAEEETQKLPIWAYEALAVTQDPELVDETKGKTGSKQLQFYRIQAHSRYSELRGVVGTLKTRMWVDLPEGGARYVKPFLSGFPVELVEFALEFWQSISREERLYAKKIAQDILKENYNGNLTDLRRAGARTAVDAALKYLGEESPILKNLAKENEGFLMQMALRHSLEVDLKAFEHYRV